MGQGARHRAVTADVGVRFVVYIVALDRFSLQVL